MLSSSSDDRLRQREGRRPRIYVLKWDKTADRQGEVIATAFADMATA